MTERYLQLKKIISFHPGGTISSLLWNDRFTQVERSLHSCGTIVPPMWDDRITWVKRYNLYLKKT